MTDKYDSLFLQAARYGVNWLLLKAQVAAESNFDPLAVSPVGAKGLAQFMPGTWAEWGNGRDIFDPEANIDTQGRYLHYLHGKFSKLVEQIDLIPTGFAAYNWGLGHVERKAIVYRRLATGRLPRETVEYIDRIDRIYRELRRTTA